MNSTMAINSKVMQFSSSIDFFTQVNCESAVKFFLLSVETEKKTLKNLNKIWSVSPKV